MPIRSSTVSVRRLLQTLFIAVLARAALLTTQAARAAEKTTFNVAWSIYVGWMPWDYAQQSGILKKWADKYGITIKLTQMDYIESINQYTAGKFDGCVMTNMDMLTIPSAGGVDSTALIVGDYSNGNDGVVLKGAGKKLADIKGQSVNLVELSVSHYLLARGLESVGLAERDIKVVNTSDADIVSAFATRGRDRHGDLETAIVGSHGDAEDHAGVRLEQDAGRNSRSHGGQQRGAEGQPEAGQGAGGCVVRNAGAHAGQGCQGDRRARIDGQGFGHRSRRLQRPARDHVPVFDSGHRGRGHQVARSRQEDGPGAQVLLRPRLVRRGREDRRRGGHRIPGRRHARQQGQPQAALRSRLTCRWRRKESSKSSSPSCVG